MHYPILAAAAAALSCMAAACDDPHELDGLTQFLYESVRATLQVTVAIPGENPPPPTARAKPNPRRTRAFMAKA